MIDSETVLASSVLKLSASRDALAERLGLVSRGVSTRTAVLVLGGIQLRALDGRLQLAATDMELSLRTSLEANVGEEGAVVVQGRTLVDIARLLPADEVEIAYRPEEGVVHITCGNYSSRLHTYAVEDFPRLPEVTAAPTFGVDADTLLATVSQVSRSASRDESRPVLTGILVRFEPERLVMAATDSYRLSVKETPLEGSQQELEAIIPARALTELGRVATGVGELELGVHENQVVFRAGDVTLTTRRIDGQFPNYKQLLPGRSSGR
jgi:DNA polymerase III subunit beta